MSNYTPPPLNPDSPQAKYNAASVLAKVEEFLASGRSRWKIGDSDVFEPLSIFDWWPEYLSRSKLYEMRQFLREAIKLGYEGYVCFKVGATGCANGMWAHTLEAREDGYSPNHCPTLYRSFTPAYTYWDVSNEHQEWDWAGKYPNGGTHQEHYKDLKTIKQLEAFIDAHPECYRKGR